MEITPVGTEKCSFVLPFIPPEKPLQLANTIRGKCSRLKSEMA